MAEAENVEAENVVPKGEDRALEGADRKAEDIDPENASPCRYAGGDLALENHNQDIGSAGSVWGEREGSFK